MVVPMALSWAEMTVVHWVAMKVCRSAEQLAVKKEGWKAGLKVASKDLNWVDLTELQTVVKWADSKVDSKG